MESTCRTGMREFKAARHAAAAGRLAFALMLGPFAFAAAQTDTDIQVRSGGVGSDERAELMAARGDYNLRLAFASTRGPYVAGVDVKLYQQRDGAYREVYSGRPDGPWFYARVRPGRYRVEATHGGVTRTRELQVGVSQKAAQIVMQWDVADDGR
jgi:hypothetical protein